MIIYRAMSEEEYVKTMENKSPYFNRRFKFFTPNIDFIKNRVLSGEFAHGKFKPEKYQRVLAFEIPEEQLFRFQLLNKKELMLDCRVSHLVKFKIWEINKGDLYAV